ncbi:MAG: DHHA1 domain-containing protein [Candidatus Pacearchaeota archaeon]
MVELEAAIKRLKEIFSKDGIIRVITHLDTDGLTSAAIFAKVLKSLNQQYWISTVKQLETDMLKRLSQECKKQKWKALVFLDLGASKLAKIREMASSADIFVIDHHEVEGVFESANSLDSSVSAKNLFFVSPHLYNNERVSGSCLTYLFVKNFYEDKTLAQLAVLGLIGDVLDKNIGKTASGILQDAQESGMQIKKGLTVFSSMRPVHKALEFSSSIFIPGVTGSNNGALMMLRDLGIEVKTNHGYKTLLDLNKEELSRLITAILLRRVSNGHGQDILDNIYLIKILNHQFDAREVSTMLNACGRLGYSSLALAFLMGSKRANDKIEEVYAKYKHHIIKALNWVNNKQKIQGDGYVIINAKNAIKDTIIGTIVSIVASSYVYDEGTVIVGMAYRKDSKIKVSARVVKDKNNAGEVNLYHLLKEVVDITGGEVGGHANAAGCLITKEKEQEFLELLEKKLNAQEIKVMC